jgi:hypothetical protein
MGNKVDKHEELVGEGESISEGSLGWPHLVGKQSKDVQRAIAKTYPMLHFKLIKQGTLHSMGQMINVVYIYHDENGIVSSAPFAAVSVCVNNMIATQNGKIKETKTSND